VRVCFEMQFPAAISVLQGPPRLRDMFPSMHWGLLGASERLPGMPIARHAFWLEAAAGWQSVHLSGHARRLMIAAAVRVQPCRSMR
jgi:hypothetical protein